MTEQVKQLVGRLMASPRVPDPMKCEETLAAFGEERLTALVEKFEEKPAEPAKPAKVEPAKPRTLDEWLAEAPAEVRSAYEREQAREARQRESLIRALSTAQKVYSPEQLRAMPTEQLESTARLLSLPGATGEVVDYRGLGQPVKADDERAAAPPDPWALGFDNNGRSSAVSQKEN